MTPRDPAQPTVRSLFWRVLFFVFTFNLHAKCSVFGGICWDPPLSVFGPRIKGTGPGLQRPDTPKTMAQQTFLLWDHVQGEALRLVAEVFQQRIQRQGLGRFGRGWTSFLEVFDQKRHFCVKVFSPQNWFFMPFLKILCSENDSKNVKCFAQLTSKNTSLTYKTYLPINNK